MTEEANARKRETKKHAAEVSEYIGSIGTFSVYSKQLSGKQQLQGTGSGTQDMFIRSEDLKNYLHVFVFPDWEGHVVPLIMAGVVRNLVWRCMGAACPDHHHLLHQVCCSSQLKHPDQEKLQNTCNFQLIPCHSTSCMSELNPQEPVPSPAPMDQPAYIPEVPEHTRTFLHFQTYPAVASWMRIHESLPFPRLLRPMLYRWAYSGGVRNYTERIDTSIDEALSRFDERVPQARVIRMRDIRDSLTNPFVSSATTVRNGVNSTVQLGDRYFLQPGRVVAASARKRYAAIYDTDGRALIRGQADSILAPVNDRLSNTLVAQFGDDAEVPRKEYSNEFSRGLRILNRAYENTLTTVLPRITAVPNHIEEVYSKNKEERGSYLLTSIETGRQLTTEAMARMGVSLYQADPEPIVLEDKEQIPVEGSSKNVESM